jgi:hypothetical protein
LYDLVKFFIINGNSFMSFVESSISPNFFYVQAVPCSSSSPSPVSHLNSSMVPVPVSTTSRSGKTTLTPTIRKVLASGFSEKALSYCNGPIEQLFEMQFILQDYIADATFSGVAFSVKDESQWHIASLQVVEGVGGGVDGMQTPSYLSVDTREDLCIKIDSQKLPCQVGTAKAVAKLVKDLENYFGTPVEIEFAGRGDQIFLLQVRAITRFSRARLLNT